jgi:hypothetical protein
MNPMLWPTLMLGALLFWVGRRLYAAPRNRGQKVLFWLAAIALSAPGIAFALYYTKMMGEPLWLYRFRALPGSELAAAGVGMIAGLAEATRAASLRMRKFAGRYGIPVLLLLTISLPHLKPVLRPLRLPENGVAWDDGVCRQSTPSTCGPASVATLARLAKVDIDERSLARECFTSGGGTENWYLARALRKHGFKVQFFDHAPVPNELPCPAIAGVKLEFGLGHFIPILGRTGTNYVIGDPMIGREEKSFADLNKDYVFTGFFLTIE